MHLSNLNSMPIQFDFKETAFKNTSFYQINL